ncbi:MAG: redoxin domain-containing protein [Dehalococcoidia bacterium]|nr:redoxin domain-containing protein [Dehalococcoidia bacterium]MDD5493773.1 redoxin domain-containing protein [Dehalococcoidia bacterium]
MTEGQPSSSAKFCRQCGAPVPENTVNCPRCGKKWYLDRLEEQGVGLWQKIMEKRAAAGLGDAAETSEQQKQYRCPSCMAVLKTPAAICPFCGKSTAKTRIVPAVESAISEGTIDEELTGLTDAARGLAAIKGATGRAKKLRGRKRLKAIDIAIIAVIILILAGIGFVVGGQYGLIPEQFAFFKSSQSSQPMAATPVLSNISAVPDSSGKATISWSTDIPSNGKVLYGNTDSYGVTAPGENGTLNQSVILSGLNPATTYHFKIVATDDEGREIAASQDNILTIPAERETIPPAISQAKAISSDIGAIIQWVTDEPANSQVVYGTTESCDSFTPLDSKLTTSHTVRLSGLESNVTYYYRIKSVDSSGNEARSNPPDAFTTLISVPMGAKIGERAPDFTLPVFKTQDSISLRSYKGQKVLVTFWAIHCPECDRALTLLQSFKNKNMPDVVILAVFLESKLDDIEKTVTKFKSEQGELTVPVLVDMYKTSSHMYNVDKLPTTFFIDADGIVRDIQYGTFNSGQIEQIIDSL